MKNTKNPTKTHPQDRKWIIGEDVEKLVQE